MCSLLNEASEHGHTGWIIYQVAVFSLRTWVGKWFPISAWGSLLGESLVSITRRLENKSSDPRRGRAEDKNGCSSTDANLKIIRLVSGVESWIWSALNMPTLFLILWDWHSDTQPYLSHSFNMYLLSPWLALDTQILFYVPCVLPCSCGTHNVEEIPTIDRVDK